MSTRIACAACAALVALSAGAAELTRGSRGHGLSVFQGEETTRFEVEILGVQRAAASTGDNVLARLSGAGLEHTGVLQGMSGSPVYVDGELIGAVMATWAFAKEPLCSIRPIGEMRALVAALEQGAHPGFRAGEPLLRAPALDPPQAPLTRTLLLEPSSRPDWALAQGLALSASGLPDALCAELQARWGIPVQGAAAGTTQREGTSLAPGDAMAVLLIDGDARLAAVGTVTERIGDRVLAFGHPMLGIGPLSLPIARARVLTAMPSAQISFKIAEVGQVVGALAIDQRAGLLGLLGVRAETLPMRVRIDGVEHRFELGRIAQLLPDLAGWCARTALLDGHGVGDDAQLDMRARLTLSDGEVLQSEAAIDGSLAGSLVGGEAALLIALAIAKPHWAATMQSLELEIARTPAARRARIERVLARPERPKAGDELLLRVELVEDDGSAHWQELSLRIPAGQPAGPLRILVADGPTAFRNEIERSAARWQDPGEAAIREALARRAAAHTLVATLYAPPRSVLVGDRELGPLPASMRALMSGGSARASSGEVAASALGRDELRTPWLLRGQFLLSLTIENGLPEPDAQKETP